MRRDIYVNISTIYQQRFKFNPFKTDDIDYPPKASLVRLQSGAPNKSMG